MTETLTQLFFAILFCCLLSFVPICRSFVPSPQLKQSWHQLAHASTEKSSFRRIHSYIINPLYRGVEKPLSRLEKTEQLSVEKEEPSLNVVRRAWQIITGWDKRGNPETAELPSTLSHSKQRNLLQQTLLSKTSWTSRRYGARTITGLLHALSKEVVDLFVDIQARSDTPFSNRLIEKVTIRFSRLVFPPLSLGKGAGKIREKKGIEFVKDKVSQWILSTELDPSTGTDRAMRKRDEKNLADETFDRIDLDKSGLLDKDEISFALSQATTALAPTTVEPVIEKVADKLVQLYDCNGEGFMDRLGYRRLVQDMASLRKKASNRWRSSFKTTIMSTWSWIRGKRNANFSSISIFESNTTEQTRKLASSQFQQTYQASNIAASGSITICNLRVDLRRLLFGAIPFIRHLTPGGPLILEPFTVTVKSSFNRTDILNSSLLDAGLRQLVARALRRRVGSLRDVLEASLLNGRSFNLLGGTGPIVRVPKLDDVEFDRQNRLVLTGRAQVQSEPGGTTLENAFKLRTKIGTGHRGRSVRLIKPELALVLECPASWEKK